MGQQEGNKKSLRLCPLSFEKSRGIVEPCLNKHPFALHFKWKELPKAGCLLIVIARLSQLTVEVAWLSEGFFAKKCSPDFERGDSLERQGVYRH